MTKDHAAGSAAKHLPFQPNAIDWYPTRQGTRRRMELAPLVRTIIRFLESPHDNGIMHGDHEPISEAPNLKTQIPNKSKIPGMQCAKQNRLGHLNLGPWNLFGIRCLELGDCDRFMEGRFVRSLELFPCIPLRSGVSVERR